MIARSSIIILTLVLGGRVCGAEPSFPKEGVAFLKQYCLACHGEKKGNADVRLHTIVSDMDLLKNRKLMTRVLQVVQSGEMPPAEKPQPLTTDREIFTKSIQSVFDHADKNAKPDPGRITMRRLNRNEYNNTIRDLIGVDINPAEDFPSDDVGHGFDNIGDVLTLPPVLMERYLAAAETIMTKAITPVPPKITSRYTGSQYTEPAGPKVPLKADYRAITITQENQPIETGPVNTPYQVPDYEEYEFRTKVYAETTGKKPVHLAVMAVCDESNTNLATDDEANTLVGAAVKGLRPFRIVKVVEVTARNAREAQEISVLVPPLKGLKRMAVALVKPIPGEPIPTLYLQHLALRGPLDSRPPSQRKLLACDTTKPIQEQSREVLSRFASRAYRRPATPDEVNRLVQFAETIMKRGEKWEAAMQQAMQAVLVSPKFLFRVELDHRPTPNDTQPIDEYQLASRLSYFLWASMPDDELFALAAKKQLTANLDQQVRRMLKDPKAQSLVDYFVLQWLQLQNLKNFQPDTKVFTGFNEELRSAMLQETRLFFQEIIREDRPLRDILDGKYTYLNGKLANHYGIIDTAGNTHGTPQKSRKPGGKPFRWDSPYQRVDLTDSLRGGVLTQASVLTVTSNPTRTSPVKRGRWVLEQLLGTPPPPAPPDVPELEKDGKPITAGTLRQRMELHRQNPSCANCHAKMDPLGFGLENFNAVGAYRTKDEGQPIDATGELPGGLKFNGPEELKMILVGKLDLFKRCLAEKMLTYALGRGLEYYDKRPIDRILTQTAQGEDRFSALVIAIVQSDPFRLRRGKQATE